MFTRPKAIDRNNGSANAIGSICQESKPAWPTAGDRVRAKMAHLDFTEDDIEEIVQSVRGEKRGVAPQI